MKIVIKKKSFGKKQDNSNLNFFKTLLTSLAIILVFSILPNSVSFIKNNFKSNEVVLNSSKQSFDEILDKQNKKNKIIKDTIKDRFSWNIFEDIDVFGKNEEDNLNNLILWLTFHFRIVIKSLQFKRLNELA